MIGSIFHMIYSRPTWPAIAQSSVWCVKNVRNVSDFYIHMWQLTVRTKCTLMVGLNMKPHRRHHSL